MRTKLLSRGLLLLLFLALTTVAPGLPELQGAPLAPTPVPSRLVDVELQSTSIHAGETQALAVQLYNPLGELIILTLAVTYANGSQETIVDSSLGNQGVLSWTVPVDAGSGEATYRLTAGGCGCGSSFGAVQLPLESQATGSFWTVD